MRRDGKEKAAAILQRRDLIRVKRMARRRQPQWDSCSRLGFMQP